MISLLMLKGEVETITSSLPRKKRQGKRPNEGVAFLMDRKHWQAENSTEPFPSKSNFFSIWIDKIQNNSHFYMNKEFGIGHYSDELELFLCS